MLKTQSSPLSADAAASPRPMQRLLLEWRIVLFALVLVLGLTAIPYVFAAATTPPGMYYTGLMLGVPDHLQYFAWQRDLATQNLAANRLTPEPNEPAFFNLLWWAMGHLGTITGLPQPALYALLRVFAIGLVLPCGYAFFSVVIADLRQRRLAFLIYAFSGGMGIIWIIAKYLLRYENFPADDVYTPEANTFFMSLAFPHFTLALALLTATFALFLYSMKRSQLRWAVAAGAVAIVLGLQHTYDLLTIYAVLSLFGLLLWVRDRQFPRQIFWRGLIIVGMSAPPALYMFLLVKLNPIWGEVLAQFDNAGVFTPPLQNLLILLGIPFWLALAGFRPRMLQSASDPELFVATWFVAHFGLVYMPTDFQIHMLLGWQLPIAVLASGLLLHRLGPWLAKRVRLASGLAITTIFVLTLLTNGYLIAWRILDLSRHENPYYLTNSQVVALEWLQQHTTRDDVVLAELSLGQFVPMWADARSFVAHWANTLNFFEKRETATQIMHGAVSAEQRRTILDRYHITYLVYQGTGVAPWVREAGYREVLRDGDVVIYQVVP